MLSPTLKDIFIAAEKLPVAPQVLAELAELLEVPNTRTEEIADLLSRDGPLAAAILRIGNSAYYGKGGVGSIETAVSRVGFREVHRLVGCAVTGVLADRDLSYYGIEAERMHEHMICSALGCEALASRAGWNARHAYTAGLLRPIGMMVLDRMARSVIVEVEAYDADKDGGYSAWEARVMQIQSHTAGSAVLSEWRFAQDVVEAIRGHHLQPAATPPGKGAALLNLAGWIVEQLDMGLPGECGVWDPSPEKLELAGLAEDDLESCAERVSIQFERLRPALV